jgi:hypothetical protein
MTITSTEFQQNVGHYLALAEKGEEININKLKPHKSSFKLMKLKQKNKPKKKLGRIQQILEDAKKYQFHGTTGETALQFQRRVRS